MDAKQLIDWEEFNAAREQLGANFARILQYFKEDGVSSLEAVERAMRERDSAALVRPAHTLKGESLQFGAETQSGLAEKIEMAARHFVETRATPEELVPDVVKLRAVFDATLEQLEAATNPLVERGAGFGEKKVANQTFGRL